MTGSTGAGSGVVEHADIKTAAAAAVASVSKLARWRIEGFMTPVPLALAAFPGTSGIASGAWTVSPRRRISVPDE